MMFMNRKKLFVFVASFLMVSGFVVFLLQGLPVASASPPPTSLSNTADMTATVGYWQSVTIANSGTTTMTVPYAENPYQTTVNFIFPSTDWTISAGGTATASYTIGSYPYYQDSELGPMGLVLPALISTAGVTTGTVYANISMDGGSFSWSYAFNSLSTSGFGVTGITEIYPSWLPVVDANTLTFTLHLAITSDPGNPAYGLAYPYAGDTSENPNTYTYAGTANQVVLDPASDPAGTFQNFAYGWFFNSVSSTYSPASDLTSYNVVWSTPYAGSFTTNGQTSAIATSGTIGGSLSTFSVSFLPANSALNVVNSVSAWTVYFTLESQIQAQSASVTQSPTSSQVMTEHGNWWSGTLSFSLTNPSGGLDNTALATTSGTINAGTYATWTVSDIAVVGYGQSPAYDYMQYNATSYGSPANPGQLAPTPPEYESIGEGTSQLIPSTGLTVNYYPAELINYNPAISSSGASIKTVNPDQVVTFYANITETISGELQSVFIDYGDGSSYTSAIQSSGAFTFTHAYSSMGTYPVTIRIENFPNAPSGDNANLYTPSSTGTDPVTTVTVQKIAMSATPVDYTQIGKSAVLGIKWSAADAMSSISLNINGVVVDTYTGIGTSGSESYAYSSVSETPLYVVWTALTVNGYSQPLVMQYGSPLVPAFNSSAVTVLQSNNPTHSYPITLSDPTTGNEIYPITLANPTTGTGTYQQLLTFDPATYGINAQGSNFYIEYTNGTPAYSWIQSINSTSISVWSKLAEGTSNLQIEVFPQSVNVLSATGYVGGSAMLGIPDNGQYVFPAYFSAANMSDLIILQSGITITKMAYNSGYVLNLSGSTNGATGVYFALNKALPNGNYVMGSYASHLSSGAGGLGASNSFGSISFNNSPTITTSSSFSRVFDIEMGYGGAYFSINGGLNATGTANSNWANGNIYFNGSSTLTKGEINSTSGTQSNPVYGESYAHIYLTYGLVNTVPFNVEQTLLGYEYLRANVAMPTVSIGSASPLVSNSSQIGYQHYATFSNDPTNLSAGQYSYSIPDSFSYNYVTVWYPLTWTFDYSSWTDYVSGTTSQGNFLTFFAVSGIGKITLTFNEPIVIGQPLGTLSIGAEPTVALDGNGFFDIPNGMIHWYANGIPVSESGFNVVVGKTVNLTAYGLGNIPLQVSQTGSTFHNYTLYTPTQYISFLPVYVNITSIQLNNLNSSNEVEVIAENAKGVQQDQVLLAPYGAGASSATIYLPSGTYTFFYTQLNYTTGQIIRNKVSTSLSSYNGMYWVALSGLTIYQLGNQLTYTNSSIQKSIQTLSITIALNDSAIKNLTLGVDLNLSATNSSIQNAITNVLTQENFIKDNITNVNASLQTKLTILNSVIHTFQSNVTVLDDYINVTANLIRNITTTINTNLTLANSVIGEIKTIDSQNFTALNSTVRNNYLSLINNISFVHSLVGNVNVSLANRVSFTDSLVNSSLTTITSKEIYTNSLINSTSTHISTSLDFINSTLNNVNLNLTDKINILNSLLNNVNLSVSTKILYTNSLINTTTSQIELDVGYENDTINYIKSLDISVNTNLTVVDATINSVKLIDKTNFTLINSTLKNNYVSLISNITTIDSIVNNTQVSLISRTSFVDSLVNSTLTSISVKSSYIDSLINSTTTNISNQNLIINSTVHDLNLNETSYFTLLNTTIHNVNLTQINYFNIIHSAVTDLNLTQTDYYNLISDSIKNVNLTLTTKFNIINTTLNSLNINFSTKFNILNSTINTMNVNQSTYFNIVHSIVGNINFNETQRYSLEKVAGTFAYHFVPKNESLLPNGVDINAWLENVAGQVVNNKSLVFSIWQNLTIQYINLTDTYAVVPKLISYNNYSVTFFLPLNATQIASIQNGGGTAELSLYSPFGVGSAANFAVGNINPSNSNLEKVNGLWLSLGFATNPPSGLGELVIWFFSSEFGRAMAELTVLMGGVLTTLFVIRDRKDKGTKAIIAQTYKNTKNNNKS